MAYREHGMWEVLEVLRRKGRGESDGVIQAATGRSRSTIRRYVARAQELGWKPNEGAAQEKLAGAVMARLRPGPREQKERGESEAKLGRHREQIRSWLKTDEPGRGLRLTKVHKLLKRQGVEVPYSSLYRYAVKECGFGRRRLTVRMTDVAPGELAEIDFGALGRVWDREKGRERLAHALIVTLVYSRHQYVHCSHSQKLEDVIAGLEDAWQFFDGVVARVDLDYVPGNIIEVFAFRLTAAERELLHKAAGPAKASRWVRTLAVAAATGDRELVEQFVIGAGNTL